MQTHRVRRLGAVPLVIVVCGVACDDARETTSQTVPVETPPTPSTSEPVAGTVATPVPSEMCPADEQPAVAAFDLVSGEFRWAACEAPVSIYRSLIAADDDAVFVGWFDQTERVAAFDAVTGSPVDATVVPPDPDLATGGESPDPIIVDGVTISGGQDRPTSGTTESGSWQEAGVWVYDDVAAIGDGAIFAMERSDGTSPSRLVAYELQTGDERWGVDVRDPYGEGAWPFHVAGQRLFTLWYELQVRSTVDGSVLWQTDYVQPPTQSGTAIPTPARITGVRANADAVFITFSTEASGGD